MSSTTNTVRVLIATALMSAVAGCGDDGQTDGPEVRDAPAASISVPAPDPGVPVAELISRGERVYAAVCLTCHQADGGGVPFMQPPLEGSAIVKGDPAPMIEIILRGMGGGGAALEASGEWPQAMGGYATMPDADIAAVSTYIRHAWGNDASPVQPDAVAALRASMPGS